MTKIVCVCGARPNFMKIAPLVKAFEKAGCFETFVVHTGQHYDDNMSRMFFEELGIPRPNINLEVGSGSHAFQTAEIMKRFEPIVIEFKPDYVRGKKIAGVTAGASTPDWVIEEFVTNLKNLPD